MALKTRLFDITEYLDDDETIAAYLSEVFREGDAGFIAAAIGDVAKARGMTEVMLPSSGEVTLATFMQVMNRLGYELAVRSKEV